MTREFTAAELEAFLEEALSPDEMAEVERCVRRRPELLQRLASINARRDAGVHTLAEIWRRHRCSCPTREQLGSFLLGALGKDHAEYLEFHLEKVGCRYCRANLDDLKRQQDETADNVVRRRTRYFQSSAGYLRQDR